MTLKIGELAKLAGVSIRTLHHYDDIGLLTPSSRTGAGYRLYADSDIRRLQQILFYRALDFPLDDILRLMTSPDFDRQAALLEQRRLMYEKQERLSSLLGLIDKMIHTNDEEMVMEYKEMFEVFPEMKPEWVAAEEAQWGHTEQFQESRRRLKNYSKADFEAMRREADVLNRRLHELIHQNVAPDSEAAMTLSDELRLNIDKWHFPCPREFYVGLTDFMRQDERYLKTIDAEQEGAAEYMHRAAAANAARFKQQ